MPSPSWTITRENVEIGVHELGSGPPIVLVHGTACDHRVWARVSRRLAPDYTVHALDRRGRGASGDRDDWTLETDARDVAAIADELGGAVPVIGHSLGGIVAIEAAAETGAIGPFVAYEPPIYGEDGPSVHAADGLAALLDEQGPEAAVERFLREVGYTDELIASIQKHEALWRATVATAPTLPREARADLRYEPDPARLSTIEGPILLLEGAKSPGDFDEGLAELERVIGDVERDRIRGASHAVLQQAPGTFVERIEAFLAEHS